MSDTPCDPRRRSGGRANWGALALLIGGVAAAGLATAWDPGPARSAGAQVWPAFVLVVGLILVGLVADDDGLFALAGYRLARLAKRGPCLFASATVLVAVVTAVLNLDTAVVFLTPVLVYAGRSRGGLEAPLAYCCLLVANASSLPLPGSNLTNLIVLGRLHVSGGRFLGHMWLAWIVSLVVTAGVIFLAERRQFALPGDVPAVAPQAIAGLGLGAVTAVSVLVIVLRSPAIPVAAVGVGAIAARLVTHRERSAKVFETLSVPILIGLFGTAVALGTLGRTWSGPASFMAHLGALATASVAAAATVLLNNLPAASLLAARSVAHPYALLVGLDIGPNLFVTGSLAWILWLRAARSAGLRPSIRHASVLGVCSVPVALVAAVLVLSITGSR